MGVEVLNENCYDEVLKDGVGTVAIGVVGMEVAWVV